MVELRFRDGRTVKVNITWQTAGIAAGVIAGVPLVLFLSTESIRRRFFVAFCSFLNGKEKKEMTDIKRRLLRDVKGKVVELGPGPGLNFRILASNSRVERWIGIEPNPYFHSLIKANAENFGVKFEIEIHADGAEKLSLANESVDTVIFTHVLCSCDDMQAVLREVDRVLKVGGSFYFLEHIAAEEGTWMRWIQDKIDPAWQFVFSGCKFLDTHFELEGLGDRYDSYMRTFDAPMPIALVRLQVAGGARKLKPTPPCGVSDTFLQGYTSFLVSQPSI